MNFDSEDCVSKMLGAASGPLAKYWKSACPVAKNEFSKIATIIEEIGVQRETHTITIEDAQDRLANAKDAARCALDDQLGEALVATEEAVDAAFNVITSMVNGALGMRAV